MQFPPSRTSLKTDLYSPIHSIAGMLYQWLLQQGVDSMVGVGGTPTNVALAVKKSKAGAAQQQVAQQREGAAGERKPSML
jgi:hypothetical protein